MKLNAYKNTMIAALLLGVSYSNVLADLAAGDVLAFSDGSKLSVEASPGFWIDAALQANKGLIIGAEKSKKDIDKPFHLFGQAGKHLSSVPVTVISADANSAQLDFSAWAMKWKGDVVSLGAGGSNAQGEGVADVKCEASCNKGESFTLVYSATIPSEVDALGGFAYRVYMVGTIK